MTSLTVKKREGLGRWMHAAGLAAAEEERDTHGYTNRTGMLEGTTASYIMIDMPAVSAISLMMPMDYASYVVTWAQGKGLPNIEPIADRLDKYFKTNLPRYFTPGSWAGAAGAKLV